MIPLDPFRALTTPNQALRWRRSQSVHAMHNQRGGMHLQQEGQEVSLEELRETG